MLKSSLVITMLHSLTLIIHLIIQEKISDSSKIVRLNWSSQMYLDEDIPLQMKLLLY